MRQIGRKTELLVLASVCLILTTMTLYRYQSALLDQSFFGKIHLSFMSVMSTRGEEQQTGSEQYQDPLTDRFDPVCYLWCAPKSFEFDNYLSVLSVLQHLKPDRVILMYLHYPVVDRQLYHVWLGEILQKYPFMETLQVPETFCTTNGSKEDFMRTFYKRNDLILWEERAMLTSRPSKADVSRIMANRTEFFAACSSASSVGNQSSLPFCIALDRNIFPKDIWKLDTPLGQSMRKLFYGSGEIPSPVSSYQPLVPNIAHVMWIGGGEMDFLFYLSMLSLLYVAEVDKVFLYGDAPTGSYWSLLKDHKRVQVVPHKLINRIYGRPIDSLVHMSDVLRVEVLKRYGGIYLDTDAIVVRPFDREIRSYDVVVSIDAMPSHYRPFPDVINNGVMLGKKDAKFWTVFQESMKQFIDEDYTYNGCRMAYQLLERHPHLIHVDPHLQVECYQFRCHPTWWPDYQNPSLDHLSPNVTFDWRNEAYVIHWTSPNPNEYANPQVLLKSTGMFAEIGQLVLAKSNLTRFFEMQGKT